MLAQPLPRLSSTPTRRGTCGDGLGRAVVVGDRDRSHSPTRPTIQHLHLHDGGTVFEKPARTVSVGAIRKVVLAGCSIPVVHSNPVLITHSTGISFWDPIDLSTDSLSYEKELNASNLLVGEHRIRFRRTAQRVHRRARRPRWGRGGSRVDENVTGTVRLQQPDRDRGQG